MTNPPFGTYDPASAQVNGTAPTALDRPRLYLDLDGVMADFDAHFPATFGLDHRSMADDALWATINAHPSYFRDMPPCPGAVAFFRTIEHLDPIILTACPSSAYAEVARQKRAWVREHLSKDVVILPVMGGKSKPLFMHAPGDILIDDFARNTDAWTAEGGVAILHKTFAETTARLRTALGLGDSAVAAEPPAIEFTYRNWRGETAVRKVRPSHLWFGATDWHPEPQWLLHALDCEKDAYRDFALIDITFGPTWQTIDTAPEGVVVWTKIDNADGERNIAQLQKHTRWPGRTRSLWLTPDGEMYVYYTPTHWSATRPIASTREAG